MNFEDLVDSNRLNVVKFLTEILSCIGLVQILVELSLLLVESKISAENAGLVGIRGELQKIRRYKISLEVFHHLLRIDFFHFFQQPLVFSTNYFVISLQHFSAIV